MTQYDAASSGTVVDEVGFSFDGWGNVTDFDQDHNSVVNGDASRRQALLKTYAIICGLCPQFRVRST